MLIMTVLFFGLTVGLFYCPEKVVLPQRFHGEYLSLLPLTGMLSAVFARVPQIITNFKQGHTGQVSEEKRIDCSCR